MLEFTEQLALGSHRREESGEDGDTRGAGKAGVCLRVRRRRLRARGRPWAAGCCDSGEYIISH